ncbi:MAG: nickel pincer cofactor biosynthesis protein LarC [Candidatus Thermoplasmatota archaeon]
MTVAYFDCFSGVAGDMILGALLDLGFEVSVLEQELKKLGISGYHIAVRKTAYHQIAGTDVSVEVQEPQSHRHFFDIKKLIEQSSLNEFVKKTSIAIFHRLAEAERTVHNVSLEEVHFHEVGAVDAIVDIVGSVLGIHYLNIKKIYCSPLPLGKGFISCEHGVLPVPAPATVELLKNIPVYTDERRYELVTPTGAAIISTLATQFGSMPLMKIYRVGYGAGKTKSKYPHLLRVFLGELYQHPDKSIP